jgi:predicted nucleic acid-binding protein
VTLLDAYALIAFLSGEGDGHRTRELMREGKTAITTVNLAEAADVLARRYGVTTDRTRELVQTLADGPLAVLAVEERGAWRAGQLRAEHYHRSKCPLSLADCVLLASARTGDRVATADAYVLTVAAAEGIATAPLAG